MSPESPTAGATAADPFEQFVERCTRALSHQLQGVSEPLLELWSRADDVVILGAIGSYAVGWERVRTHLLGAARSLDWSELTVERLHTSVAGDLAFTVVLEQMRRPGGDPAARTLRTTQAYRREDGRWRLILRHANAITPADETREHALGEVNG
jgi:ketosteroid isomerase-like protein